MSPTLDVQALRDHFPALQRTVGDQPAVFFDGPGGTQSPTRVIDAMADYLRRGSSNHGGPFLTSREADAATDAAREAMRDLLNARRAEEIVFGQNMTSLTFSISRAIARRGSPGTKSSSPASTTTPTSPPGCGRPRIAASRCAGSTSTRPTAPSPSTPCLAC
jgi:selenocysteine lyase/cysteine desulfurase